MNDSSLERSFDYYWSIFSADLKDIWVSQCRFDFEREWRFDRAIVDKMIAVELHGGGFVQGRHHRESGMASDFEKHNLAIARGWRVFYATTSMLDQDPERFFKPLVYALHTPILSQDAAIWQWTARIANLTHAGDWIEFDNRRIERLSRNRFRIEFPGHQEDHLESVGGIPLAEAQKIALETVMKMPAPSKMRITQIG